MRFKLLGPVQVLTEEGWRPAGPPQQRTVLAALLVDAPDVVRTEVVLERVWGEDPPDGARRTLHSQLARLRRLAGGGKPWLVHDSGGYAAHVDPEDIDLHRFRIEVRSAKGEPDGPATARQLAAALARWHGDALAGLPGSWAERVRYTLGQERLDATVAWAGAELAGGNAAAVVGPLTELQLRHRHAESPVRVLMTALHALGRSADALELYGRYRRQLAEELGTDPSPALEQVQLAVLRGDGTGATVVQPGLTAPAPPPAGVSPAQLPRDVPAFVGRGRELACLDTITGHVGEPGSGGALLSLSGTAGVGKTSLAVHWAHLARHRFPDGQLFLNLRGYGPGDTAMQPEEGIRALLDAFGVRPESVPAGLDAQIGLYRSLQAGRRILLVLDNARDAGQARPLITTASGCVTVLTSRDSLAGLAATDGAHLIALDLFDVEESTEFLRLRLGPGPVAGDPAAVGAVVRGTAGLPLALSVVSARMAASTATFADLAAELEADDRLDALDLADPFADVRTVLSWSYRALDQEAARQLRRLAIHPATSVSLGAAASLAGTPVTRVSAVIAQLTSASLLQEPAAGRFALHDLLRAYVLGEEDDPEPEPAAALRRMYDHYLRGAFRADRLLYPQRQDIVLPAGPPGVEHPTFHDADEALAWFTAEHATLLAVLRWGAATASAGVPVWQLAWSLTTYLDIRGHWHDLIEVQRAARTAAEADGDLEGQFFAAGCQARAHGQLGQHREAESLYEEALGAARALGDPTREALVQLHCSWLLQRQERYDEAILRVRAALALFRRTGGRSGEANSLNMLGWQLAQTGRFEEATGPIEEALALLRELEDEPGQASAWDSLGLVRHRQGRHAEAVGCYRRALELFRHSHDRYEEASTSDHLGTAQAAAGDRDGAAVSWRAALEILEELEHPDATGVRERLRTLAGSPERAAE